MRLLATRLIAAGISGLSPITAPAGAIAKAFAALKDTFKVESIAPGHCTGEPTFAALRSAFGEKYQYAGLAATLPIGANTGSTRRGEGPALQQVTWRPIANSRDKDPFGILPARRLRTKSSQLQGLQF